MTFVGKTVWSNYRPQFEATAESNGWTDQEKATALILVLSGKALEILPSIPDDKQNSLW